MAAALVLSRQVIGAIAVVLVVVSLLSCAGAEPPASMVVRAPPPLFALRSSFWLNLHQRLYAETMDPHARQFAPPQHGADAFTADERATWDAALAYYRSWIPQRHLLAEMAEPLLALNARLSRFGNATELPADGLEAALVAQLTAAARVYRAHGWADDDRVNRAWIAALEPRLAVHGQALAHELAAIYGTPWPAQPVTVEVAPYVGSVGAYTSSFVTMTSSTPSYQGDAALEMVFHEASHLLSDGVEAAIARESQQLGQPVPDGLWHAVVFYTAGELVRRRIPGYVTYADQVKIYNPRLHWDVYRRAIAGPWQRYLDGQLAREPALAQVVAEVTSTARDPV